MEDRSSYQVTGWWTSGKAGIVRSSQVPTVIHFTAPVSFGGDAGRWTPEELMLAALASCFVSTFQAIANYSKLPYADLEIGVSGEIEKTSSGFQFTTLELRPKLTIADEELRAQADRVLRKSEALCLVGRAIQTPKVFIPQIVVGVPVHALAQE
jgi:organic hydroperoxide reductase OsmC/OhrA